MIITTTDKGVLSLLDRPKVLLGAGETNLLHAYLLSLYRVMIDLSLRVISILLPSAGSPLHTIRCLLWRKLLIRVGHSAKEVDFDELIGVCLFPYVCMG